jgi:hydrophobic/amphiphilic exporter-1 (mainly G- bacteria), HAE1 family
LSTRFIILLAVPLGLTGVLVLLYLAGTTLNVQSLMGVSDDGRDCRFQQHPDRRVHAPPDRRRNVRARSCCGPPAASGLRPVLMTSLATIIGLMPMALKLGTGSESYAPLAQSIIGGLLLSLVFTVFLVPAAFLLVHGRREARESQ